MAKTKGLKVAGIISAVLAVIWAALAWGPRLLLFFMGHFRGMAVSSIGIIGGADGPTAVVVASSKVSEAVFWVTMVMPVLLATVSVICLVWRKKLLK